MEPQLTAAASSSVLVINTGSSTLKWTLFDAADEGVLAHSSVAWGTDRRQQIETALAALPAFNKVVHRIVHGGGVFHTALAIDGSVRAQLEALVPLDPLHMQPALEAVALVSAARPHAQAFAVFDSGFHNGMPAAAGYGLPLEWEKKYNARRFGFHGLSVAYAKLRAQQILGQLPSRMLVCHLGSGCSITGVLDGRSIDTTMGFSPLEGLIMGTRAGSVDPGLLLYLMQQHKMTAAQLEAALTHEGGLLGLSNVSANLHEVWAAAQAGNVRAALAYDRFMWSAKRGMGGMMAALGGFDALVFTGGIGENSAHVRSGLTAWMQFMGVKINDETNAAHLPIEDEDLAAAGSIVPILAIHSREDLTMLREVLALAR